MPNARIVVYAKSGRFEYDAEDGTLHAHFIANGMELEIIQTRNNFLLTMDAARTFWEELETAEIVEFKPKG